MSVINPNSPHPHYREAAVAVPHFKNLLAARTNPDGSPKPGYAKNVAMLKREIAAGEKILAAESGAES